VDRLDRSEVATMKSIEIALCFCVAALGLSFFLALYNDD
jgi:hypothetical protein